jgi:hypothetical protein
MLLFQAAVRKCRTPQRCPTFGSLDDAIGDGEYPSVLSIRYSKVGGSLVVPFPLLTVAPNYRKTLD